MTQEDHLVELERLRNMAVQQGELSVAVKAESLRGDVLGFYVDRKERGGIGAFKKQRTADELRASIKARSLRVGTLKLVPTKKPATKAAGTKKAA